ncbi:MAG TPA: serine--tRNA ligase [Alphaproteobacteria bacterium]|nr:serine--tRNA ligase [Alphaproteobacteria bacterium]
MIDPTLLRTPEGVQAVKTAIQNRGGNPSIVDKAVEADAERRKAMGNAQNLQAQRNALSKQIGEAKRAGESAADLMKQVEAVNAQIDALNDDSGNPLLAEIPNIPQADVPVGKDESDNLEIRKWGTPKQFDFTPKAHDDVAEGLGMLDLPTASKISGARFAWLQGPLARLDRAMYQYTLDYLSTEKGFTEAVVPYLVHAPALVGTGQLPKFEEDLFKTTDGRFLIPTAEVPLTNYAADTIFKESDLPIKFTAHTPCFRSEAGSAGKDTKGILRQHQFDKVEMVILATPEQSAKLHEEMTAATEELLRRLELPYRTIMLCTGDMGFGSTKTYDIEVWVPSQNTYRELSSCSNCGDFQARRMKARYKKEGAKETTFIHTLNGSGLTRRALVAILENFQNADGSVTIPPVLRPHMGGLAKLEKAK